MNTPARFARLASLLAAVGGLAYAVEGGIVVRAPQPDHHWHTSGYAVEAAFIVALLATLPLPPLFHAGSSRVARVAARIVQAGFAGMLISAVGSLAAGGTVLGPVFLVGVLASLAGLVALTVPALRSRPSGWWMAPLAFVGLLLSMVLGDHGGGILFGLAWIAISIGLRDTATARFVVAGTAVLAAAAIFAAASAGATPTANANAIVLDAKQTATHFVDNMPKGESSGDTIQFTDVLRQHGHIVGYAEALGTLVDQARDIDELQGTIRLSAGEIMIAGISVGQAATQTFAIVGGTGSYARAHGTASIHTSPHATTIRLRPTNCQRKAASRGTDHRQDAVLS